MKKIYKYQIETGPVEIRLPEGAQILSVGRQGNMICVWALVDPSVTSMAAVLFITMGTGWAPTETDDLTFLGTTLFHDGGLVFHTFYKLTGGC